MGRTKDRTIRLAVGSDRMLDISRGKKGLAKTLLDLRSGIELSVGRKLKFRRVTLYVPPGVEVDVRKLIEPQSPLGLGVCLGWRKKRKKKRKEE